MICLSNDKLAKIVEERNSTSRYLDSLNINDSYFEGILSRIYLQVKKANASNTDFGIYTYLFQTDMFHPKFI